MTDTPIFVRGRPVTLAVILLLAAAVIVAIALRWGAAA